jgi:4-amino-4-deoxy-L-arabinose transferase-like glycosyltransferase
MAFASSPHLKSEILNLQSVIPALLAATLFRTLPLLDNRFHPDEALYATFGRLITSGQGVLLSQVVVDKPPLSFYLTALSFLLVGQNELGARLPTLFASLVSVALLFALARRLYSQPVAHLAAWALALSPFAILFSITVFVDPLLTAFGLWGLWMTVEGRPKTAGLALALALATKQTGLMFAPLALGLALLRLPPAAPPADAVRLVGKNLRPMLIWLAAAIAVICVWDAMRHAPISFWEQGYADNEPGRFVRANEVRPRALAWLNLLYHFTASPPLNLLFLVGLPWLVILSFQRPSRASLADLCLVSYFLLYLSLYWLLAFNVWDRYLVPLAPLFALLFARILYSLSRIADRLSQSFGIWSLKFGFFLLVLLPASGLLLVLPSAWRAAHSGYAIGGDHGAYDGIDDVARFVHTLPADGVVYDHWLSWEFNFYLFDRPLYVSWFPSPGALTTDLLAFGRKSPRYLVTPSWEAEAEVRAAAALAGFEFVPVHQTHRRDGTVSFVVYQLAPDDG